MLGQKNCGCPPSGTVWAPQEEIHLQGQDCAGNLTDFVGKPTQIVQTVPKPGAVQEVKFCGELAMSGSGFGRIVTAPVTGYCAGRDADYYSSDPFLNMPYIGFIKFREVLIFNTATGDIISTTKQWTLLGDQWYDWVNTSELPQPGVYNCYGNQAV